MLERDAKGRILGGTMERETRMKISRAKREQHRRARNSAVAQPDRKKCSRADCERAGQWLIVPDDFRMRKRKLKGGEVVVYPAGECNVCARKRADIWRDKFIAEHGEEAWKARVKEWNSRRDREKKNRYNREYGRMRRAEMGMESRGPWRKYRHEMLERLKMVPVEPFVKWFQSLNGTSPTEKQLGDRLARAVRRATSGETKKIRLDIVDDVGVIAGYPHIIHTLYGGI